MPGKTSGNPGDVLVEALQQTLDDESFEINTAVTVQARKSAEILLEWCLTNKNDDKINAFSKQLLQNKWFCLLKGNQILTAKKSYEKDFFN